MEQTYWSLDEFADAAHKYGNEYKERYREGEPQSGDVTWLEALVMTRKGWNDEMDTALDVAESAVLMAEKEHMLDTFAPQWDVTGAEVDVARYLQGEPECMIDFPLTQTSKSGRVITLCASVAYSWAVEAETIQKRGQLIVALALALSRLGHATELWADISSKNIKGSATLHTRILVKGADDELDPSRIMFAYAHPAMLRIVDWSQRERYGKKYSPGHCFPIAPVENLPEGTIYLPELKAYHDVPDADEFLRQYLGELGLLAE